MRAWGQSGWCKDIPLVKAFKVCNLDIAGKKNLTRSKGRSPSWLPETLRINFRPHLGCLCLWWSLFLFHPTWGSLPHQLLPPWVPLYIPSFTWMLILLSCKTFSEHQPLPTKVHPVALSPHLLHFLQFSSVQFSCSVVSLCYPMDRSTPGLPVHHQLPEFTQTHVHRVGDAIQPSHPLFSPSPPSSNLSQNQGLSQWVSSSHQVAKVLVFQLQHQSFQWTLGSDLL